LLLHSIECVSADGELIVKQKKLARTQDERSTNTRTKLINATLDCLHEVGAARTSTNMVAARAGVSRGALTHHYTTKEDLFADAIDRHLQNATQDIRSLAEAVRTNRLNLDGFLDRLCEMFLGRLLLITLEHVTEARHNEHLRIRLISVVKDFHAELDNIWREFFSSTDLSVTDVDISLNMTLCLFRGMGMQTVLREDPEYYRKILEAWKVQVRLLLAANRNPAKVLEIISST
jgi:AcrR family transcriptional regulator